MTGETLDLALQRQLTAARKAPEADPGELVMTTADELGISEEYLLGNLQEIITLAMEGVPVFNKEGDYAGNVPQLQTALRAIETGMKHRGMLTEHHETAVTGGITISIVGVDPDQLT